MLIKILLVVSMILAISNGYSIIYVKQILEINNRIIKLNQELIRINNNLHKKLGDK